jgi:hypothetical protein
VREENNDLTVLVSNNIAAIRKTLYMGIMPLEDSAFESDDVHLSSPLRLGVCWPAVSAVVVNILRTKWLRRLGSNTRTPDVGES